ncbi:YeiH family protein [Nonomuraea cavernae]|uniref:Membrane protein n=1 Tax=Nonomuraea cavernae TaxID=2045107 RepID=A0A917Z9F0_9ACTN|nr:putative sulfate exporter family transporter [Nonomuraea cavernae]MCA2189278.1 putative sulfate exporter family transporter [Nonomuraea cavernae]GGO76509.1 membrane protein [Nonomuraea cavernae]
MPFADRLPGVAAALAAVVFALAAHHFVPAFSPAMVAVVTGAVVANVWGIGERLLPGLRFVARRVLRVAIVLLGLQIAVPQLLALGWQAPAIIVVATGVTFTLTPLAGRRLGLPPGTSLLVAAGVSICGAAAVAAMRQSTDATDDDAAAALSVVVLYGSAAILVVPLAATWLGLSGPQLGVWTGAAVHEVAQVAAIGSATGVLATAVTVKLGRVVLLAPIIALTTARRRYAETIAVGRGARADAGTARGAHPTKSAGAPVVPLFVAGFLAMVALRGTGLVPSQVTAVAPEVTGILMAAAMFALGTGIDVRTLVRAGRVLALGALATGCVAAVSLAGVLILA